MLNRLKQQILALMRRPILGSAVLLSLLAASYWLLVASDRYVSESRRIIQRTDISGGPGLDEYAGMLVMKAQAYAAQKVQAITQYLVGEGERFMNGLALRLAKDQVGFLEQQVSQMSARAQQALYDVN